LSVLLLIDGESGWGWWYCVAVAGVLSTSTVFFSFLPCGGVPSLSQARAGMPVSSLPRGVRVCVCMGAGGGVLRLVYTEAAEGCTCEPGIRRLMCGACGATRVEGTYVHLRPIMRRLCVTRGDVAAVAGAAVAEQSAVVSPLVGRSVGRSVGRRGTARGGVTDVSAVPCGAVLCAAQLHSLASLPLRVASWFADVGGGGGGAVGRRWASQPASQPATVHEAWPRVRVSWARCARRVDCDG
uniref:Secreted protein n=1 Tax=Taenia asiatica TaxID=60517 RepID=A0A0R3W049_TAEAS